MARKIGEGKPDKEGQTDRARRLVAIHAAVDRSAAALLALSEDIHEHPELAFQEHRASTALADYLERNGFAVERGVAGIETAFRATTGAGGPTVAFLAEYDALPEIGHGCGHNLIAISNVGAGVGAKAALAGLRGRVQVIGTPAEEAGGGKIRLLDAGVFEGVDVALSSHPGSHRTVIATEFGPTESLSLALAGFIYEFHGKASHAALSPHEGVNALNAVIRLFTGIDAMRQHVRDDVRMHGVITDGGTVANIVPAFAAASFMLRSRDREYLKELVERVRRIADGAALETGARLTVKESFPFYENVLPNVPLSRALHRNAPDCGLHLDAPAGPRPMASTDFGNVTQRMPSAALSFAISETPISGHSTAMAEAAASPLGNKNAFAVAKTLAATALDLLVDPTLLQEAKGDFEVRAAAMRPT